MDEKEVKKLADEAFEKIPVVEVVEIMRKAARRKKGTCKTPGKKIRSKGRGRGLARGKGGGPMGVPYGSK